jgi:hypothetical protein
MIFFLRVSVKNRNPYLKTSAGRCCAGEFNSGVKGLKPSGSFMFYRFNIKKFDILTTECIFVVYMDLRMKCDYFAIQH